jgi:phosphoribosyl 1,2-cyclic phosphodiesterase
MKLTFLGTRGAIEQRSMRHRQHTSLMVEYHRRGIMIDCGTDWLADVFDLKPHAIVLTHAHPDHAYGLQNGSPCVVYATEVTWEKIRAYPIESKRKVPQMREFVVEGIKLQAFPVEHSVRAPAVGYRITAGRRSVFYSPDLVFIPDREKALRGVDIYIGDGATLDRSMIQSRGDRLIGHAPIQSQLAWCQEEGVPRAIITHCGSSIVSGERIVRERMRKVAAEFKLNAEIAYDGMVVLLR